MGESVEMEIEEIIEAPTAHLDIPFFDADYFELFYRLERLESHIENLRIAAYKSEEERNIDLKAARKARDAIKRYTHTEEMRSRTRDWQEIPLGEQQQQLILDYMIANALDPQSIPRQPGALGIKSVIKTTLQSQHANIFRSDYSFDEAWKMLRRKGVIKDA